MAYEINMKFKPQCPKMKFYWNPPMLMGLCIIYNCFPTTVAKLSNYKRLQGPQSQKYLPSGMLQEKFVTPGLE